MRNKVVTIAMIAINIAVFVVLELLGNTEDPFFMIQMGALYPPMILEKGQYWRFLSSAFLHFGLLHLMNNMVILACAGPFLEEALGHVRFLILYLAAALGGGLLSFWDMTATGEYVASAGASGAIFGVISGLLWVVIRHKGHYGTLTTKGLLFMIALCLYYGISTAGVDNWGHLGGLFIGFVVCVLLYRIKPQKD